MSCKKHEIMYHLACQFPKFNNRNWIMSHVKCVARACEAFLLRSALPKACILSCSVCFICSWFLFLTTTSRLPRKRATNTQESNLYCKITTCKLLHAMVRSIIVTLSSAGSRRGYRYTVNVDSIIKKVFARIVVRILHRI